MRQTLRHHKAEILPVLEAMNWLRPKLATPQRIAGLIREWAGERDGINGRWIADLNKARQLLGVQAYEGEDGLMWWKLQHPTVQ